MRMKRKNKVLLLVSVLVMLFSPSLLRVNGNETSFQTNEYSAAQSLMNFLPGNFKTNISIVYMNGYTQSIDSGISSWKSRGYNVYVMISASHDWTGNYVEGKFDGKPHYDEVQTFSDGKYATIGQGYYMVPTRGWINYLKAMAKKAIKAGAEGIALEEPEFWVFACYSSSFKNLWKTYYGFTWIDPKFNETATYLSKKLMSLLYYNLEKEVFDYVKEINNSVVTLLATHSPLNYAEIGISTPFALTLNISSLDGYIAQVWSFSAQYPIYGERLIFEHAFLEYSYFQNLVEGTNKTLFLLMDPKSDEPGHPWDYYRRDYEKLVVAAMMINCTNFELLPWPERVFGDPTIPKDYVYELVNVFNTFASISPLNYSFPVVGIPISDSYLWQSNSQVIYLLALPLLRSGIRVELFPIERVEDENFLKKFSVIILNYESWHPSSNKQQEGIIKWLRNGGKVIFFGSVNNYSRDYFVTLLKLLEIKNPRISYSSSAIAKNSTFSFLGDKISLVEFLSINGSNFSSIYCDNVGNSVVFFKKFYNGSFIFLGIPLTYFSSARNSFLLNAIYNSLKIVEFKLDQKSYLIIKRGFVIALYSFYKTELSGKYLNLFSPGLEEVTNPTFSSDQYALLLFLNSSVKVSFAKFQVHEQQYILLALLLIVVIVILLVIYFLFKARKLYVTNSERWMKHVTFH